MLVRTLVRGGAMVMVLLCGSALAFPGASKVDTDPAVQRFIQLSKPQPMDSVTILDGHGQPVDLSEYRGQPVMINLWATWCPPCVRELPSLERFRTDYEQKGLKVIPIATDQDPGVVRPFLTDLGLAEFNTWFDNRNRLGNIVPTDLIPATYILDEEGRLVAFVRSFVDWDHPSVRALMDNYLPKDNIAVGSK